MYKTSVMIQFLVVAIALVALGVGCSGDKSPSQQTQSTGDPYRRVQGARDAYSILAFVEAYTGVSATNSTLQTTFADLKPQLGNGSGVTVATNKAVFDLIARGCSIRSNTGYVGVSTSAPAFNLQTPAENAAQSGKTNFSLEGRTQFVRDLLIRSSGQNPSQEEVDVALKLLDEVLVALVPGQVRSDGLITLQITEANRANIKASVDADVASNNQLTFVARTKSALDGVCAAIGATALGGMTY